MQEKHHINTCIIKFGIVNKKDHTQLHIECSIADIEFIILMYDV